MKGDMREEKKILFCIKQRAEMYTNENFVVVIKMLTTNFCWINIHGKIFWQALKLQLLLGEGDDAFISVQ